MSQDPLMSFHAELREQLHEQLGITSDLNPPSRKMMRNIVDSLEFQGEIQSIAVESGKPQIAEEEEDDGHRGGHVEGRSLFIGDLPNGATEADLWQLFNTIGPIHTIDIKRCSQTGSNRGYGFVVFKKATDAVKAKETLANATIRGRSIRIGWAQKNARLFVALLPKGVNLEPFIKLMEQFGPIVRPDTHISSHNFGFVRFQHRNDAEKARAIADSGYLVCRTVDGRESRMKIRVGWGDEQTQRNCVHVQFDPTEAQLVNINENDLREYFKPFGSVAKTSTPRHANQMLKGYGFVHYVDSPEGEVCAARAILELDGVMVRGVTWRCNFGKRKRERKGHDKMRSQPRWNRDQHRQPRNHQRSDLHPRRQVFGDQAIHAATRQTFPSIFRPQADYFLPKLFHDNNQFEQQPRNHMSPLREFPNASPPPLYPEFSHFARTATPTLPIQFSNPSPEPHPPLIIPTVAALAQRMVAQSQRSFPVPETSNHPQFRTPDLQAAAAGFPASRLGNDSPFQFAQGHRELPFLRRNLQNVFGFANNIQSKRNDS